MNLTHDRCDHNSATIQTSSAAPLRRALTFSLERVTTSPSLRAQCVLPDPIVEATLYRAVFDTAQSVAGSRLIWRAVDSRGVVEMAVTREEVEFRLMLQARYECFPNCCCKPDTLI